MLNVSAKYGFLLLTWNSPPSPVNSRNPVLKPPINEPPEASSEPSFALGIPMSLANVGLTPQAPPTPQLNIEICICVRPNLNSFNIDGLNVCVSLMEI